MPAWLARHWLLAPISGRELWCRLPWVDRATCNWSLTRSLATYGFYVWAKVVMGPKGFTVWSNVALGLLIVLVLSKKIEDFATGARALASVFRRRMSDAFRAPPESPYQTDEVKL